MAHRAVQRELADHQGALDALVRQLASGDEYAQGDGQVVGGAFFAYGGRGQVDGQAVAGEEQAGVLNGRFGHALAAFLHGGVGQSDDDHVGQALPGVDLYFDDDTFQTDDSTGVYFGKHGISLGDGGETVNRRKDDFVVDPYNWTLF